ncbi:MAG TPA: M13 family metallopeptidase [Steroidobacteraceae bacterium]|jgi:predicted metalloendopeptidase
MKNHITVAAPLFAATCLTLLCACQKPPAVQAPAPALPAPLVSGIDLAGMDTAVRAQDDFYKYANGKWLATTQIPADLSDYGTFYMIYLRTQDRLRGLLEDSAKAAADNGAADGRRKIGDLYLSFMDEATLEQLGLKPLNEEFALIEAVQDKAAAAALMGTLGKHLSSFFVSQSTLPIQVAVHQDNKDSTRYVADIEQAGLGLPDRDYYLKDDDAKLKQIRDQYRQHIEKMMSMAGDKNSAKEAQDLVALETDMAKIQWTKVALRDPIKTYNKVELSKLPGLAPGFDWAGFVKAADIDGKTDYVIVGQPTYLSAFAKLFARTPLPLWKSYLRWHVLNDYASLLNKAAVDENFAFKGTALLGTPENRARWKRAASVVDDALGESLGKLYVDRYFPPQDKARVEELVKNLLSAFAQNIDSLDWMGPETKKQAHAKLAKIAVRIGYPNKWRDYSSLVIAKDDLVGNVRRARAFEYARNINKLKEPIDRGEWDMTPQTVNADYNPELNAITFPAAILQSPFFNPQADDAANYGAIGAVIGHEISHAFDDQGAQFDGDGNLKEWWTKEDHDKFAAKSKALVSQYNAYSPLAGYNVNGELTLGENIGDNSGLAVAYKAYVISLGGKPAAVLDGMTGDQRFYVSFAQAWRDKRRDNYIVALIKADPHSPPEFRGNGTVANQPAFYSAFDVKPGDKMYLSPEQRVIMW